MGDAQAGGGTMNADRLQQIIPAIVIAIVGVWVCYISYTQQPAEGFLFPRIISTVFAVLAVWAVVQSFIAPVKPEDLITRQMAMNIAPGLIVALIYGFWAAKFFGFYTATAICFFILLSLYDPASHRDARTWVKRLAITGGFVAVLYGLFSMTLNVYTPREILF